MNLLVKIVSQATTRHLTLTPPRQGGLLAGLALACCGLNLARVQGQVVYSPYDFISLAGNGYIGSADGPGWNAQFYEPSGLAVDGAGNIYVADSRNNMIRSVTPAGVVTTLAGSTNSGSADGTGGGAGFDYPYGIAVDSAGNLYVADGLNHTIRMVTPAGAVTTLAGLAGSPGSADGTGSDARFNFPKGIALDAAGNVYVADGWNDTIRKMTPAGMVTTLAGMAGTSGSADGTGSDARFDTPTGVAVDTAGNVYVADYGNHTIRKVTPLGDVTTLAGLARSPGATDAKGSAARFETPAGVAVDSDGNVYVAEANNASIRRVTPAGGVTTVAGLANTTSHGGVGGIVGWAADGTGSTARFRIPLGVAVDSAGLLYVADSWDNTVRVGRPVVYTPYTFTTLAGNAGFGSADAIGRAASFNQPWGITVDRAGNLYVTDYANFTVRKITPRGVVTTLAGMAGVSARVFSLSPYVSSLNTDGVGNTARFGYSGFDPFFGYFGYGPEGIAADSAGNLYVADTPNNTIRKVTPSGVVTTLAGSTSAYGPGNYGAVDGTNSAARFTAPSGVVVDGADNLYVADAGTHLIRKVTPSGLVTTLAGMAYSAGSVDGTNSTARFNTPADVAVDNTGNLYVADQNNHTIRKITPRGKVTTLAGLAGSNGSTDGTGSAARFYYPSGVAVDNAGNVYVADQNNDAIRRITPGGIVTTLAGQAGSYGNSDGTGSEARFNSPTDIVVDDAGNLYVTDQWNNTIRKVTPAGAVTTLGGLGGGGYGSTDGPATAALFGGPSAVASDNAGNLYVAESDNNTLRRVTPSGTVITIAGLPGSRGSNDGTNSAALFNRPSGVATDNAGNAYVADTDNHTIRKVTPDGVVTTLAGLAGTSGSADGAGNAASFYYPYGIAADRGANLYVADTYNNTIRKVTPDGMVTTLAGMAGSNGNTDGIGNAARFSSPIGVAVDSATNVYVADGDYAIIRKVTPAGQVTTLAGCATCPYGSSDGTGSQARFVNPWGIAVDDAGNIFVSDYSARVVRKITPGGVVTTLAGLGGSVGSDDGTGSAVRFGGWYYNLYFGGRYFGPEGIALDRGGNLYVADYFNNTIRKGFAESRSPGIVAPGPGLGAQSTQFGFILTGPQGLSVIVEASTDLVDWQLILTNTFAGPLEFNDPESHLFSRRFYRAGIR